MVEVSQLIDGNSSRSLTPPPPSGGTGNEIYVEHAGRRTGGQVNNNISCQCNGPGADSKRMPWNHLQFLISNCRLMRRGVPGKLFFYAFFLGGIMVILLSCKSRFRHLFSYVSRQSLPARIHRILNTKQYRCHNFAAGSGDFRLSENSKTVVFNDWIVTGGETACFAPTLTRSAYGAFATIRGLFIIVKVGARSPRPHIVGVFSDSLISFYSNLGLIPMVINLCFTSSPICSITSNS